MIAWLAACILSVAVGVVSLNLPAANSITFHGVASDGVAIPNTPVPTPTPAPTATPEPPTPAPPPVSPEAIIAAYPWPVDTFIAIAWCESEMGRDLYNETPAWTWDGSRKEYVENHGVGLFQVLWPLHAGLFAGRDPYDHAANVDVAYQLYRRDGLAPWASCLR